MKGAPSSFDLRDQGVVSPIRSQGNWGTCWGFASIAACETSILSKLGLTQEEFLEEYGKKVKSSKNILFLYQTHQPSRCSFSAVLLHSSERDRFNS
ncbi:MAG: hypothetical protein EOM64_06110 [Erysipelotrichia bacterium]|nr:hypothetical protein [Erysipelotrichia bacterium]